MTRARHMRGGAYGSAGFGGLDVGCGVQPRVPVGVLRLLVAALSTLVLACGGYTTRLEEVRLRVDKGDLDTALATLDEFIVVGQGGRNPQAADLPLLLLERGAIRQAALDHAGAAADFTDADPMIETLEFTPDRTAALAEYLWSGSSTVYRAPVYEKLMINMAAAASFLAEGQTSSARVEARRIGVSLQYFDETDERQNPVLGAASYLAGLAMELGGEPSAAIRYYLQAADRGWAPGLEEAIVRLSAGTPLARHERAVEARARLGLEDGEALEARGEEIVIIIFAGRAPYRVAEHIPVGTVMAWYRMNTAYALTAEDQVRLNAAIAGDLLTYVNIPTLTAPRAALQRFDVRAGAAAGQAELVADIGSFVIARWEEQRPAIALAGITRALTRVVTREVIAGTGRALDSGNGVGRAVGMLLGLATQGAMQAADVPDTRSWSFMPNTIHLARIPATSGEHDVRIRGLGSGRTRDVVVTVRVPPGGAGVATVRFLE